eukprot:gene7926-16218_t
MDYITHTPETKILEPFNYISQIPGKDVRGTFIDCFQSWLQIPEEKLIIIKDIIRSLHNASLLVDDIEDNSKLRRGVPVAHSIFGVPSTINCANYVYFLALQKCRSLGELAAIDIFLNEVLNLHRGQGLDILWRDQCHCPTESEYRAMVHDKTGGLFRLAVCLMQVFSDNKADFSPLVNLLGVYFQIRDDYINIASECYMRSKSYCEDITEGKFSFPMIHGIRAVPEDTRLLHILRMHTDDVDVKRCAVKWLEQCGSMEYTRSTLRGLLGEVLGEIELLGGHGGLSKLIRKLDNDLDIVEDVTSTSTVPTDVPSVSVQETVTNTTTITTNRTNTNSTSDNAPTTTTISSSSCSSSTDTVVS